MSIQSREPSTRGVAAEPYSATMRAPFAALGIRSDGVAITGVAYLPDRTPERAPNNRIAALACREIERYLSDPAFRFSVPLRPGGTAFQHRVWDAIRSIPLAESRTYGEVARSLHSAARAVGQACGANRIALIVPCHRVVGSRGSLGGFMGTTQRTERRDDPLAIKRWLLAHEGYRFGA